MIEIIRKRYNFSCTKFFHIFVLIELLVINWSIEQAITDFSRREVFAALPVLFHKGIFTGTFIGFFILEVTHIYSIIIVLVSSSFLKENWCFSCKTFKTCSIPSLTLNLPVYDPFKIDSFLFSILIS